MGMAFGAQAVVAYKRHAGLQAWIAEENEQGVPTPISTADRRLFGFCLLNDWSVRDVQRYEMPPLGPFLGKSLHTSVSPWVITADALAPFATERLARAPGAPPCPPHLATTGDALAITMRAALQTPSMNTPQTITDAPFARMYWTPAQMVAHHTSNGCNLLPGDLLGSGTVSGPADGAEACIAEMLLRGPIALPNGETRRYLEDGDSIIFTARAEAPGAVPIGFGECRGKILPPLGLPAHAR